MTRDGRFKREVRRAARASGEPYTRARARLDEARRHPHSKDDDEARWTVVYTFAGVEDWLGGWLLSTLGGELERVLVPRYQGGPIVPGMLLLEVTRDASAAAPLADLRQLPYLTDYLGAPAEPTRLTWEGLREVLRIEGSRTRLRLAQTGLMDGGRAQVPTEDAEVANAAPEGGRERLGPDGEGSDEGVAVAVPENGGDDLGPAAGDDRDGRLPEESLYDRPGRFPRVARGSVSEERETQHLLQQLLVGPTEGERAEARTALLHAHGPLVEDIVARFGACAPLDQAELLEAGRQGLSHALESFDRAQARTPPPGCRRVDFRSYVAWCVRQSVTWRIARA